MAKICTFNYYTDLTAFSVHPSATPSMTCRMTSHTSAPHRMPLTYTTTIQMVNNNTSILLTYALVQRAGSLKQENIPELK